MSPAETDREARDKAVRAARWAAHRAAIDLARDTGATIVSRPAFRGAQSTVQDIEPLAGLRAARDLELGARYNTRNYVRDAREAGHTWQEIGEAMEVTPNGEAELAGDTIAEAAYSYAAGRPDSDAAWRYGRSFTWRCASCDGVISDKGPFDGPVDSEPGHADDCTRRAAAIAAWDAESARLDAEWEAGR